MSSLDHSQSQRLVHPRVAPAASQAIGVFDSGVGGLTVARAVLARLPQENLIYLGDTARVPYGTKSPEVVTRYSLANARLLMRQDLKLLVVACNTASAMSLPALQAQLPIPVVGVIEPGAAAAVAASRTGRIGIIGTPGTVASGAYQAALQRRRGDAAVLGRACALFVPLAEEGWTEGEVVETIARKYLADFGPFGIDTLVLGCTHYVFVADELRSLVGPQVRLIETGEPVARQTRRLLHKDALLTPEDSIAEAPASIRLLTTGALAPLQAAAERWLQLPPDCCATVSIP